MDNIIHNNSSESCSLRELGPTLVGESAKYKQIILNIDWQEIVYSAASAENWNNPFISDVSIRFSLKKVS